ncbi:YhbY family RNA-binding protein [endosymbiont 'TC1' of Trimyema compressum]|uniref:YhbY family RNA-binding protein n=1 Tax=endosymbiont 'TC1' of Trimyema compressum TaxID=243899 RepID=UPI001FDF92E1|nr:YhbY family RNA-binding protein [endosymbiont 'TC1' of Trimyema compressum]
MSEAVIKEVSQSIDSLDLVKVRVGKNGAEDIKKVGADLAEEVKAELVQVIGRNCLLFK